MKIKKDGHKIATRQSKNHKLLTFQAKIKPELDFSSSISGNSDIKWFAYIYIYKDHKRRMAIWSN